MSLCTSTTLNLQRSLKDRVCVRVRTVGFDEGREGRSTYLEYVKIKPLGGVTLSKLNKLGEAIYRLYRSQILQKNLLENS